MCTNTNKCANTSTKNHLASAAVCILFCLVHLLPHWVQNLTKLSHYCHIILSCCHFEDKIVGTDFVLVLGLKTSESLQDFNLENKESEQNKKLKKSGKMFTFSRASYLLLDQQLVDLGEVLQSRRTSGWRLKRLKIVKLSMFSMF